MPVVYVYILVCKLCMCILSMSYPEYVCLCRLVYLSGCVGCGFLSCVEEGTSKLCRDPCGSDGSDCVGGFRCGCGGDGSCWVGGDYDAGRWMVKVAATVVMVAGSCRL